MEVEMAKKRGKQISFDAMVKFFIQHYDITTSKDIKKIMTRLDLIEMSIKSLSEDMKGVGKLRIRNKTQISACDTVLEVIKQLENGGGFAEVKARTGFNDKKIRNTIYRLSYLKKNQEDKKRTLYSFMIDSGIRNFIWVVFVYEKDYR